MRRLVPLILALGACRPSAVTNAVAHDPGPVVALVNGRSIHAKDVEAQAQRAGQDARTALDLLIGLELLAEVAERQGFHRHESVLEDRRGAMVNRFVEAELAPKLAVDRLPERDLRAAYEKAKTLFVHGRLARVVMLTVPIAKRESDPERIAERKRLAEDLARFVAARPSRAPEDFYAIVGLEPWSTRGIVAQRALIGPETESERVLVDAALALRERGETSPVLERPRIGFTILRFDDEEPPRNIPFEVARREIAERMYPRWAERGFKEFCDELAATYGVQMLPGAFDRALLAAP